MKKMNELIQKNFESAVCLISLRYITEKIDFYEMKNTFEHRLN